MHVGEYTSLILHGCISLTLITVISCFADNRLCSHHYDRSNVPIIFISDHLQICHKDEEHWPVVLLSFCFLGVGVLWHWHYNRLRHTLHARVKSIQDLMFFVFVFGWSIVTLYHVSVEQNLKHEGILFSLPGLNPHRFGVGLMLIGLVMCSIFIWEFILDALHEDSVQTCVILSKGVYQNLQYVLKLMLFIIVVVGVACIYLMGQYMFNGSTHFYTYDDPNFYTYRMMLSIIAEYVFTILGIVFVFLTSWVCCKMRNKFLSIQGWDKFDTMADRCVVKDENTIPLISFVILICIGLMFIFFPIY